MPFSSQIHSLHFYTQVRMKIWRVYADRANYNEMTPSKTKKKPGSAGAHSNRYKWTAQIRKKLTLANACPRQE